MRILYLVGRNIEYPRNDVLRRACARLGSVDVVAPSCRAGIPVRSGRVLLEAIPRLLSHHYDLLFVGFYGHLLMLPLAVRRKVPILFDAFLSTYDTLVMDRKRFAPGSLRASLAFWLDRTACRLSTHVLLDTREHVGYFARTFGVPAAKMTPVAVGCNEDVFYPRNGGSANDVTRVLYYCTYRPLHGAEVVVRAASLLRDQRSVKFILVGDGPELRRVYTLASSLGLENLRFVPFLPQAALADEIAHATICLGGHFGTSEKAGRVVPSKIYQLLAMAKPVIAGDAPANRSLLHPDRHAVFCRLGDPRSLADAILHLRAHPDRCRAMAQRGRELYLEACSEKVITANLRNIVDRLVA